MRYDIWTDGSADGEGSDMGAGWIVLDERNERKEYASPIMAPRHGSSDIAEIVAATMALCCIPGNSEVILHTDSRHLMHYFNEQSQPAGNGNHSDIRKKLYGALGEFFTAASRHTRITILKTSETSDSLLRQAHHRAQEAAGLIKCNAPYSIWAASAPGFRT